MKGIKIIFLFAGLLFLSGTSAQALNVYVMDSQNTSNMDLIGAALTTAGHSVTVGVPWHQHDTPQGLSSYDVVVFLQSYNWSSGSMDTAGQQEILNFVQGGGGLVTSEWFVWSLAVGGRFDNLSALSPVSNTSAYRGSSPILYTEAVIDPILTDGVPDSFSFAADNIAGTETYLEPKPGAVAFFSSDYGPSGAGLIGWDYGFGKVISFSTVIGISEMSDANYSALFVNSVEWAGGEGHVVPIPAALWLLGSGLIGLIGLRRKLFR